MSPLRAAIKDMAHLGCIYDDTDTALAFGKVRGYRLVLANLRDDENDFSAVEDEIGDCAGCLRCLMRFLAGLAGSMCVTVAELYDQDEDAVVRQVEKQLDHALDELGRL
jgi:hypothetical protein